MIRPATKTLLEEPRAELTALHAVRLMRQGGHLAQARALLCLAYLVVKMHCHTLHACVLDCMAGRAPVVHLDDNSPAFIVQAACLPGFLPRGIPQPPVDSFHRGRR